MFRVVKFFELFFEERKNKYKVWFLFFNFLIFILEYIFFGLESNFKEFYLGKN